MTTTTTRASDDVDARRYRCDVFYRIVSSNRRARTRVAGSSSVIHPSSAAVEGAEGWGSAATTTRRFVRSFLRTLLLSVVDGMDAIDEIVDDEGRTFFFPFNVDGDDGD